MVPATLAHWTPATLRERGVAVPFTSPSLAGARVRLLDHRPELVLPNPAGARGVYLFPLATIAEYCAPTLHDVRLAERLAVAFPMSPPIVRRAALSTAAEGAAGRAATAPARGTLATEATHVAEIGALLIGNVLDSDNTPDCTSSLDARRAVLDVARRAGRSAEAIKADIDGLAASIVASGLNADNLPKRRPGRCRLLVAGLRGLDVQIASWRAGTKLGTLGLEVDPAISQAVMSLVVAGASALLDAAQATIADLPGLLRRWAADPAGVADELARADWMLDGWEPVWLLWRLADSDRARADAIAEMSMILPNLPGEMAAWFAGTPELQSRLRACGGRPGNACTPAVKRDAMALVQRNERMRAMAA